jgi:hypothetical protein
VFTTYDAAWQNAANLNWRIRTLIAEISIPDEVDIVVDGLDERGHCNLYELTAAQLLSWVTRVIWGPSNPPLSRN